MLTEPTQHARPLLGDVGVGAGITIDQFAL